MMLLKLTILYIGLDEIYSLLGNRVQTMFL